MTNLSPDNWKEKLRLLATRLYYDIGEKTDDEIREEIFTYISDILSLQKQALKDEAVRRIDGQKTSYKTEWNEGLEEAKDIIRNL